MLENLRPKKCVNAIQNIDYTELKDAGVKGLLLDLDDTLLPRNDGVVSPIIFNFIENLKDQGFKICLLSNNFSPLRVKKIAAELNIPFVPLAYKPLPFGYYKAMRLLGLNAGELAAIGDQLFMDILGGNRLGIFTILVKPLRKEKKWYRQIMRDAEEWVLEKLELA